MGGAARPGRTLSSTAVLGHRVPKDRKTGSSSLGRFTHRGSDGAQVCALADPGARVRQSSILGTVLTVAGRGFGGKRGE